MLSSISDSLLLQVCFQDAPVDITIDIIIGFSVGIEQQQAEVVG